MRFSRWYRIGWLCAALLILLFQLTPAASQQTLPDPNALLNKAAQEVQISKSFKIKLQLTGAPSFVDPPEKPGNPGNTIAFISANGMYVAPDRVSASVVASILGVPGKVDVVAIGDDQWMKNQILTAGKWIKRIFSPGFNAAQLISSETGIQSALKAFKDVKLVGKENVDGVEMWHITGTASGGDIGALTVGLIRGADVLIDVYIPVDTGRADRVIMVQPDTVSDQYPKPTTWSLEMFDYNNEALKIDAPDAGQPASGGLTPPTLPTAAQTAASTAAPTAAATK